MYLEIINSQGKVSAKTAAIKTKTLPNFIDLGNGLIADPYLNIQFPKSATTELSMFGATTTQEGADLFLQANYPGWRLPQYKELFALSQYPVGNTQNGLYWSANRTPVSPGYGPTQYQAQLLDFNTHYIGVQNYIPNIQEAYNYFLPVQGDLLCASSTIIDNGDGTFTDTCHKKMWTDTLGGYSHTMSWLGAMHAAANTTTSGYTNWRLPSILELVEVANSEMNFSYSTHWALTKNPQDPNRAWVVVMYYSRGYTDANNILTASAYVRLVRDIVPAGIAANIDNYFPNNPNSPAIVQMGQSTEISVTFTNTGNTAWQFIAGASVWDSKGSKVADYEKTLDNALQPGAQTTVSWNHIVNKAGDYWLQFAVWKAKPYITENLLDRKPVPSQRLIVGILANQPPNRPNNISPANGQTGITLTPTLKSSPFSDPDPQDTHLQSDWEIRSETGDYSNPVFGVCSFYIPELNNDLTQLEVPSGVLEFNKTYYWHVRYQDNHENWSEWSVETSFKTVHGYGCAIVVTASGVSFEGIIDSKADEIYKSLKNLGFEDECIYYLNDETRDVDGDGNNDVDNNINMLNLEEAITDWAPQLVGSNSPLILYIASHGSKVATLELNDQEMVSSYDLNLWLNKFSDKAKNVKIIVVIDACYSGSFITYPPSLSAPNRIVMTATRDDKLLSGILNHFGCGFFKWLEKGKNVLQAFIKASEMSFSTGVILGEPWLDDNGDGIGHSAKSLGDDGEIAKNIIIGKANAIVPELQNFACATLQSPGELRVYDSQGRVTGLVNGNKKEEIPNSAYIDESEDILIFPADGVYQYEVIGTDTGSYNLPIAFVQDGKAVIFSAVDIPISTNAKHQYIINWDALSRGEKGATVRIDSNGDGTFEQTINTGPIYTLADTFPIPLKSGWNNISLCLNVMNSDILSILAPIQGFYKSVWAYDPNKGWVSYIPDGSPDANDLTTLEPGKGYAIYMDNAADLWIMGNEIAQASISLSQGWNFVGYNFLVSMSVEDATASLPNGTCVYAYNSEIGEWRRYIVGGHGFLNTLEVFEPGRGYWIYVGRDCIWSIDFAK
ncbi:DUF1566 domain-containing protein [Candidatus Poribacteria bacterium]|nr:DUF1566 domain-containing protein [Candidatus Poribacteria bacterium]